jgi:2-dehydropantoate 2-reductase
MDQWPEHVDRMKRHGLTVRDPEQEFTVPVNALHLCEVSGLRDQFDLVFLAVKSYDTLWSTHFMAPHLKPMGLMLSAQNGMNDEVVAGVVGFDRTAGCVVQLGAATYEPGCVVRTEPTTVHTFAVGELSGQVTPRVRRVAEVLRAAGPSEVTSNIGGARWSKMVVNCMGNALAGLLGPAASSLSQEQQELAGLVRMVLGREVVLVAQQLGVAVEPIYGVSVQEFAAATTPDALNALRAKVESGSRDRSLTPDQVRSLGVPARASLLQDVIKGRRTEIDYLNGYVVDKGREVEVPVPLNQATVELVNKVERGEAKPGPANLQQLERHLAIQFQ